MSDLLMRLGKWRKPYTDVIELDEFIITPTCRTRMYFNGLLIHDAGIPDWTGDWYERLYPIGMIDSLEIKKFEK